MQHVSNMTPDSVFTHVSDPANLHSQNFSEFDIKSMGHFKAKSLL